MPASLSHGCQGLESHSPNQRNKNVCVQNKKPHLQLQHLRPQASGRPQLCPQARAQGAVVYQQNSHCNLRYSHNPQNPHKPGTTTPCTSQVSPNLTSLTSTSKHYGAPLLYALCRTAPLNTMAHHRSLTTLNPKPHL